MLGGKRLHFAGSPGLISSGGVYDVAEGLAGAVAGEVVEEKIGETAAILVGGAGDVG